MPGANSDWIFKHIDSHHAVGAALIAAVGYTILLWPARRHSRQEPAPTPGAAK
jgi:hypothetical protein